MQTLAERLHTVTRVIEAALEGLNDEDARVLLDDISHACWVLQDMVGHIDDTDAAQDELDRLHKIENPDEEVDPDEHDG